MLGLQSFDIGFDFVYGVVAPLVFAVIHNFVYGLICLRFSMVFVLALTVLMVSAVLMVLCVFLKSLHIPPRFDYAELFCYDFNYFQMLLLWF